MNAMKGIVVGAVMALLSANAVALSLAEALVFDHKLSGVYRDGAGQGLVYIKREGEHMIIMQGKYAPIFRIDSVSKDSIIEHTINVIDGNDDIHTLNLISSILTVYDPEGDGYIMTRVRSLTDRDLARINPVAAEFIGVKKQTNEPIKASFDCAKAGTTVEKLICSSKDLAALDIDLAQRYKSLMTLSDENGKSLTRNEQRDWIRERNKCNSVNCLARSYKDRISELDTVINYLNKPAEFR